MRSSYKAFIKRSKKNRDWYWHIESRNGKTVAVGGEGYRRRIDCLKFLWKVMDGLGIMNYVDLTLQKQIDSKSE